VTKWGDNGGIRHFMHATLLELLYTYAGSSSAAIDIRATSCFCAYAYMLG